MKLFTPLLLTTLLVGCASAPRSAPLAAGPRLPAGTSFADAPVMPVSGLFSWPVRGYVIAPFGAKLDRTVNKGINIRVEEGAIIRAARAGRVVYCDPRNKGFGKTVILDHGSGYQTVYAYNSEILVKVGDSVGQNDAIARGGRTGRAKEPSLHFEIRKNSVPQNPNLYLRQ